MWPSGLSYHLGLPTSHTEVSALVLATPLKSERAELHRTGEKEESSPKWSLPDASVNGPGCAEASY